MRASRILPLSLAAFCGLAHNPVTAHEMAHAEDTTVLFIGGGLQSLHADRAWPTARLPGILEAGSAREDVRGESWSYFEFGVSGSMALGLKGELKLAQHGENAKLELESAWIAGEAELRTQPIEYKLGRQLLPLGLQNLEEMHSAAFGIAPIVMRAAFNDSWRADGLRTDVEVAPGLKLGAGIWRNDGFPGAPSNKPSLGNLHANWSHDAWQVDAGYAHVRADGRALTTLGSSGHSHTLPACGILDANWVCFEGDVDLISFAVRWTPAQAPWWLAAEWHAKQDQGQLDSLLGKPDYTGKLNGGWLDFGWTFSPRLDARFRLEQAVASHDLVGASASLVANQAGIANSDRYLRSYGAALNWRPGKRHFISAEWHHENIAAQSDDVYLIRYQFSFDHRLGSTH